MQERLKLLSIQSALFIRDIDLQNPLLIAQGINSAAGNAFNGAPAILPLQKNTPPNVPLIILKSKNDKLICNVSHERVDYRFVFHNDPLTDIQVIWDGYLNVLKQITEYFCIKNPVFIWRCGFVCQFFGKLSVSANKHIAEKYLREGVAENTWDVNVNILHRFKLENRYVNRWLKIRPIRNRQNQADDSAMIVEVDFNTLQEDQKRMEQYEIDAFFEDAYSHLIHQDLPKIILD